MIIDFHTHMFQLHMELSYDKLLYRFKIKESRKR